jgi:hypothetical protein
MGGIDVFSWRKESNSMLHKWVHHRGDFFVRLQPLWIGRMSDAFKGEKAMSHHEEQILNNNSCLTFPESLREGGDKETETK